MEVVEGGPALRSLSVFSVWLTEPYPSSSIFFWTAVFSKSPSFLRLVSVGCLSFLLLAKSSSDYLFFQRLYKKKAAIAAPITIKGTITPAAIAPPLVLDPPSDVSFFVPLVWLLVLLPLLLPLLF